MPTRITIIINQRPHRLDHETVSPEEFRRLAEAPNEYEVWRIEGSPDPEGQLPIDDVQITQAVQVHNGQRFRVVPPGTFGASA